jgi:hypothetical protein
MDEEMARTFIGRLDIERGVPPNRPETFCPVCSLAWKWLDHTDCAASLGLRLIVPAWGWPS